VGALPSRDRCRRARLPAAVTLASSLAGCGSGEEILPIVDPSVSIGTGFPCLEPLGDDETVPIIMGIQGGFHVWGGFEARGLQPDGVEIDFKLVRDGVELASASYIDDIDAAYGPASGCAAAPEGAYQYAGVAVVLFFDVQPESVSGASADLSIQLRDRRGVVVSDSVRVVPECCSM